MKDFLPLIFTKVPFLEYFPWEERGSLSDANGVRNVGQLLEIFPSADEKPTHKSLLIAIEL